MNLHGITKGNLELERELIDIVESVDTLEARVLVLENAASTTTTTTTEEPTTTTEAPTTTTE